MGPCGARVCSQVKDLAVEPPAFIKKNNKKVVRRRRPVVRRKPVSHAPVRTEPVTHAPVAAPQPVVAAAAAVPEEPVGFAAVRNIEHCTTGEIIPVNVASIDANVSTISF